MVTAYQMGVGVGLVCTIDAAIRWLTRYVRERQREEMMGMITRSLLASVLLLLIMLGWLGDSLLSALIGRPKLSFQEVYKSWRHHLLHP